MLISDWSSDVCSSYLASAASSNTAAGSALTTCAALTVPLVATVNSTSTSPSWPDCSAAIGYRGEGVLIGCSSLAILSRATASSRCLAASFSRSEEHTSELQSLMRISYAVFCSKKNMKNKNLTSSHKCTPLIPSTH